MRTTGLRSSIVPIGLDRIDGAWMRKHVSSSVKRVLQATVKVIKRNRSCGLTRKTKGKHFTKLLTGAYRLSEIVDGCAASNGVVRLLIRRKAIEVLAESVHSPRLPFSNSLVNTVWCFTFQ